MKIFESFDEYLERQSQIEIDITDCETSAIHDTKLINDGLVSRIAGGMVGVTLGRFLMKKILTGLGVSKSGVLYKILTSKVVTFAVGSAFKRK
jgi:hypothetical protein